MTTLWFLLFRRGNRTRVLTVVAVFTMFALYAVLAPQPAVTAGKDARVVGVYARSSAHVSMILAATPLHSGNEVAPEGVTVSVGGTPVPTTVTPMASSGLSVAVVIDTAADTTPQALQAIHTGVTEFLLRLPADARTMVVDSGAHARVVAPLSRGSAKALAALSASRSGGARSTAAAVLLAAQRLAAAPPGPRAIVVYSSGPDQGGPSVEQLTGAISRATALVSVIQSGGESIWPSVVSQTGGKVLRTDISGVVKSSQQVATALEHQYLVTFASRYPLPAVAEVTITTGDHSSATAVPLPAPTGSVSNPGTQSSAERLEITAVRGRWFVPAMVVGLLLALVTLAASPRVRRRAATRKDGPPIASSSRSSTPTPTDARVIPGPIVRHRPPPADEPTPPTEATVSAFPPVRRPSGWAALSAAVDGLREAEQALESQPDPRSPRPRRDNHQPRHPAPEDQ